MAKIIFKWRYLKPQSPKHNQNLIRYIATRDGVETPDDAVLQMPATKGQKRLIQQLLQDFPAVKDSYEYQDYRYSPTRGNASEFISRAIEENVDAIGKKDNYIRYIANRPHVEKHGAHGLFTDADTPIDLDAVAREVAQHKGNVWTNVLSIRREDAARLGYETGDGWRNLLRGQAEQLAVAMHIPLADLRWYAAYHNEGHHPHCHIVAYSVGREPYASEQSMTKLKAAYAREMFAQDRLQIYQLQTQYRDSLSQEAKDLLREMVESINDGSYQNPEVEAMLLDLNNRLKEHKGKLVYGYLTQGNRNVVNGIIDELAKEPRIAALYDLWYEQQCLITRIYQDTEPEKLPMSQNPVFKPIKNALIQEALRLNQTVRVLIQEPLSDEVQEALEEHAPVCIDTTARELPIPATADEAQPPPVEAMEKPASTFGRRKKNTWWNETYQQARTFLYGTKDTPPDHSQAFGLMMVEAKSGNGLAMHDLGKIYLLGLGQNKDEAAAQKWFASAMEAFQKMESTAKSKDYWQYRIGKLHAYGYGTPQDYTESALWFERAADANNPFAAYTLGGQYYRGQGVEQDHKKAFDLFTAAANHISRPNAYAQYQLGAMYKDGIGTEADTEQSEKWYREAYQGFLSMEQQMADDKLYYRLGTMNLQGIGTPKDLLKAKAYLEKAAALENADAMYGLGKLYLDASFADYDPYRAMIQLRKAAAQDHSYAQYTLGKLLYQGEIVPQDIPEALSWLGKAADGGNDYAQYFLGKELLCGGKIEQNIQEGMKLLEAAASQGNLYAHYILGKVYADGEVIPADIAKALRHLEEAAKHDFSPAQYRLAKLLLAEDRIEEAVRWLEEAIWDDNQYAQYTLGKMLLFGQNVEKDVQRGMALLQASAAQGNGFAQRIINHYGQRPVTIAGVRLFASLGSLIQNRIAEDDHKQAAMIDRKLRHQIEMKKQALGLKMG